MRDLAGFLLARISEDEDANRDVLFGWHEHDCAALPWDALGAWCSCGYPARVLAECEAKRRIVERAVDTQRHAARSWDDEYAGEAVGLAVALIYLALPYADHPDYEALLAAQEVKR